jgi:2-dehydro-3-deoxygalactonokinase
MMATFITIDGGTTNTRLFLIKDMTLCDSIGLSLGARVGMEDPSLFRSEIKGAIDLLLSRNSLSPGNITRIIASGMITSAGGLCELPHLTAPLGIRELHAATKECFFPEISEIPFVFIRGVKSIGSRLSELDMMRGEETELMGIIEDAECAYLLPGSHSKIIYTDSDGRITDFSTYLSGEMLYALSEHTILKSSVSLRENKISRKSLIEGYEYAIEHGLNNALFKTRILDTLLSEDPEKIYSFFLGAVLSGEVSDLIKKAPPRAVIGGRSQIREALYILLGEKSNISLSRLSDEAVNSAVWRGAVKIYETK